MQNAQSSRPEGTRILSTHKEGDNTMFRRYILARKAGVLLALSVLALLVAHPWNLRASTTTGGAVGAVREPSLKVDAPFGAIPPGAYPAGQAGAGPIATGNGMAVGRSYKNDTSPPLRDIPPAPIKKGAPREEN